MIGASFLHCFILASLRGQNVNQLVSLFSRMNLIQEKSQFTLSQITVMVLDMPPETKLLPYQNPHIIRKFQPPEP
jgi:hypothetical protein